MSVVLNFHALLHSFSSALCTLMYTALTQPRAPSLKNQYSLLGGCVKLGRRYVN